MTKLYTAHAEDTKNRPHAPGTYSKSVLNMTSMCFHQDIWLKCTNAFVLCFYQRLRTFTPSCFGRPEKQNTLLKSYQTGYTWQKNDTPVSPLLKTNVGTFRKFFNVFIWMRGDVPVRFYACFFCILSEKVWKIYHKKVFHDSLSSTY